MYPSGVRAREYICIYVCMYVCAMGIENLDERMGQILRSGYEGGGGVGICVQPDKLKCRNPLAQVILLVYIYIPTGPSGRIYIAQRVQYISSHSSGSGAQTRRLCAAHHQNR